MSGTARRARAAVIGCGAISKEHLHVLGSHPRIELVGVCDRSPAASTWTASRYASTAFTDHRELLASARPDVVHVLTPPASHRSIAEDALVAGAHVSEDFGGRPAAAIGRSTQRRLALAGDGAGDAVRNRGQPVDPVVSVHGVLPHSIFHRPGE